MRGILYYVLSDLTHSLYLGDNFGFVPQIYVMFIMLIRNTLAAFISEVYSRDTLLERGRVVVHELCTSVCFRMPLSWNPESNFTAEQINNLSTTPLQM